MLGWNQLLSENSCFAILILKKILDYELIKKVLFFWSLSKVKGFLEQYCIFLK